MKKCSAALRVGLVALLTSLGACGGRSDGTAAAPGPGESAPADKVFETIHHDIILLPEGVEPWAPTWAPDGRHILFNNIVDGTQWIATPDGRTVSCLSCDKPDIAKIPGAFSYIFPDNRRMFLSNELGDLVYVLECAPSLYDCDRHEFLPVDLSADSPDPLKLNLGRRTYHLAPDGEHLAYNITRPDALVMMVSDLQRTDSGYAIANPRVINPPGPSGPTDTSVEGWSNGGQLYEFKSFADGGASAIVVGEPSDGNADALKINLATGAITRLTANMDWDEDGAESPDNRHYVVASWRTMQRLESLGVMPLARPFFDYPLGAAIAIYYVSSFPGFQCDLQPWLLPAGGDKGGTLVGQPLAPYKGGDIIAGNNLSGLSFWSPDSTRVLIQERLKTPVEASANDAHKQKGHSPNRLLIARINRKPTAPAAVVRTEVGAWAPGIADFTGSYMLPHLAFITGKAAGFVTVIYGGNVAVGAFDATYVNYSEDGENFLNGTQIVGGSVLAGISLTSSLTSSDAQGNRTGGVSGSLLFVPKQPAPPAGEPPMMKFGSLASDYKGRTAAALPEVGACHDSLPTAPALILRSSSSASKLIVTVTADIHGDVRPVRGATVTVGDRQQTTDDSGNAVFARSLSEPIMIRAAAGDTFESTSLQLGGEGN